MKTYLTKTGDTWDKIALNELGSEYLLPLLLQKNQKFRQYVEFPEGITLTIPEVTLILEEAPEWMDSADDYVTEESEPEWLKEEVSG